MRMFSRHHPYFCAAVAYIICAGKSIPDEIKRENVTRYAQMHSNNMGLTFDCPTLNDAWDRLEDKVPDNRGRKGWRTLSHDLTNLLIEWNRQWTPWATKFFACLGVLNFFVGLFIGWLLL